MLPLSFFMLNFQSCYFNCTLIVHYLLLRISAKVLISSIHIREPDGTHYNVGHEPYLRLFIKAIRVKSLLSVSYFNCVHYFI